MPLLKLLLAVGILLALAAGGWALFLPASLVAAIFGMNFENFSREHGGFGWALILLVAISAVVFWLLRRWGLFRL